MTLADTHRILLQNKFDRVENLVQVNNQATLAIPAILGAIWGIEGGLDNFQNALILSVISIGLILIWRYFAHYIDNDIVNTYIDIIRIENLLGVPTELAMFDKFVDDSLAPDQKRRLDNDQKIMFLEGLNKKKLMRYRGHDKWDKVAFGLIGLCVVVSILAVFHPILLKIIRMLHLHLQWVDFFVIEIGFFGFALLFGFLITVIISKIFKNIAPIHRDPTESEIQICYERIITAKNGIIG